MATPGLPLLEHLLTDAHDIAAFARQDGTAAVAGCPGWDVTRLAGHVARVHRMATASVALRLDAPPSAEQSAKPPSDPAEVADWLDEGVEALVTVLRETPPDSPAWNFTGGSQTASFWPRRMSHETAVHRFDADMAVNGSGAARDAALAADGVDEFLGLVGRVLGARPDADTGGTLHLHATDTEGEWTVAVTAGTLHVDHGHGKGDAAVRGSASDLLLGVWGRRSLAVDGCFERFGDTAVLARWVDLGAF